jgi:NAD(P)-dependent dehydrogenase (short-subunit alcohol dehydrogenase family)
VTKGFVSLLRKNNEGKLRKVLNMSSILGSIELMSDATGWDFSPSYAISKSALNMLTKMTANKLVNDNIVVYASHPGWVPTDMGGEDGVVPVDVSIQGQVDVLDNLKIEDSGRFITYEGDAMAW